MTSALVYSKTDLYLEILDSMKLEGPSNYIIWAFKFQNICQGQDLWEVVEKPAPIVSDTEIAKLPDKDKVTTEANNARLVNLQVKVFVAFQLTVSDHLLVHILRMKCPHAMFEFYKAMFADASQDCKQLLCMKLSNLRMK
jgi:hypothetical protein